MSLHAGGVAFFGFLSAFPALVAVVSTYGLLFDQSDVVTQFSTLRTVFPDPSVAVFQTELATLVEHSGVELSVGILVGFVAALWSARKGASALLASFDLVYEVETRRSPLRQLALEMVVTVAGVVLTSVTIALVAVLPVVARVFPPSGISRPALVTATTVLAVTSAIIGTAGLFWIGPNRRRPSFLRILPAAVFSVAGMALGSWLFSIALQEFMSLEKTYGSLGTVAATLILFYACGWVVLLGAELCQAVETELARAGPQSRSLRPPADV